MEKPPGLQTILDLLVSDSVTLFHAFNVSTALVFCLIEIASIHGQVPFICAQMVQFLFTNCLVLFLASLQVSQVVKALLIFKPAVLEEHMDHVVRKYSRVCIGVYAGLRFCFDLAGPMESNAITKSMTGSDVKL